MASTKKPNSEHHKLKPVLQIRQAPRTRSIEQGRHECFGIEWHEVLDGFAGAYKSHGQSQFARDGYDYAALCGAVELGENDSGNGGGGREFARLREAILARGRVHH